MCTAVTYQTHHFYFGRTLDYHHGFSEEVVITPRRFPLHFRHGGGTDNHFAIIGMARVTDDYPLYFDAVNEKGLAMAGLNFVGYAHYRKPLAEYENVAQFELLPWVLSQFSSVEEAKAAIKKLNVTDAPFRPDMPPAQLHWILADRNQAITVEQTESGMRLWDNPVGVLTNNPPFDHQLLSLRDHMHLSPEAPENRFSGQLALTPYSRGMGALGLPGDLSSQSRFVRAGFVKLNSVSGQAEEESVSQFFHILNSVAQPRGCCRVGQGQYEKTLYTSCCNCDRGIYYYTTYENSRISAVDMGREDPEGSLLIRYPLVRESQIFRQN